MKTFTLKQIEKLAIKYNGEFDSGIYEDGANTPPSIIFVNGEDEYGIEWTESYENGWGGERFFGKTKYQEKLLPLFNEFEEKIEKELLTLKNWEQHKGKKIEVSYCDTNTGTERIEITGIEANNNKMIGQNSGHNLIFFELDENFNRKKETTSNWIYEWQGIFRRGSGAERLFIEKIF